MRIALLLLFAVAAQAQPSVGPEVVWRAALPLATYRPVPPAARVTADGDGYVVAWSEVENGISRAYAARLNAAGQMAAIGVRTIGVADAPAISPFGDRYIAAWLEPDPVDKRPTLFTAALDRNFKLVTSTRIGLTTGPPVVRTTPSRAWIGSGNMLYEVDRGGGPIAFFDLPRPLDDLAVSGNDAGYVHHESTVSIFIVCPNGCSLPPPLPHYALTFTWLYRLTASARMQFDSKAPAALASNGDAFLVVWAESKPIALKGALFGTSFKPFVISANAQRTFDELTQPQVAWDGQRWVVVWDGDAGVQGAVIAPDLTVTPFKVSAEGSRPAIASPKGGRFLVTYEVLAGERRLVSRVVDFTPPGQRERVVR
jgi:hypothetical protein